jgi:cytochrome P450
MGQIFNFSDPHQIHHDYVEWSKQGYESNGVVISNMFIEPVFLISNPEMIKSMTVTNSALYPKSQLVYSALEKILGNGLLVSSGTIWKKQRLLISPVFGQANIDLMVNTMISRTNHYIDRWRDTESIEICTEMSKLTLDIIATCAFGDECPIDQISASWRSINEGIMNYLLMSSIFPLWVVDNIPFTFRSVKSNLTILKSYIVGMINKKRKSDSIDNDLLSLLISTKEDEKISDDLLLAESLVFLLAGHETVLTYRFTS